MDDEKRTPDDGTISSVTGTRRAFFGRALAMTAAATGLLALSGCPGGDQGDDDGDDGGDDDD